MASSLAVAVGQAQTPGAANQHATKGQEVFLQKCMQCHSINKGQAMLGPSLWGEMTKAPHKKTAAQIRLIIQNGKGKMPPWKSMLTPEQVDDLIAYIHTL